MSPLDDELRAVLHGRAHDLAPSPDPLAGIERRARRIRRNRVGAAVAGSVLAVAAVAAVVPALQATTAAPRDVPRVGTSTAPETRSYALDPASPWPYRGADLSGLGAGTLQTIEKEYAVRHPESAVRAPRITPLFGQVYEPSQQFELVFLAELDAQYRWGVVVASEAGPEFLWDEQLPEPAYALAAALPGDEVPRLLVVTAPGTGPAYHGSVEANETAMTSLGPGVAVAPLERDVGADFYRVLADGEELVRADAPDPEGLALEQPDNLLGWPERGSDDPALVDRAVAGYARAKGVEVDEVGHRVLFTGANDPGQRYTVLEAWVRGQRAQVFGWIETPGREPEPQLRPLTDPGAPLVVLLLTDVPGRTTDELVVVPQPRTGQVFYGSRDDQVPVETPGLDGVVLVDRARGATDDHLRTLDGNGRPVFDGPVSNLLCGESGCG